MNYLSGVFISLCFGVFVVYMAVESFRVRQGEKRRFEIRFWIFAAGFVLVLVFRKWIAIHAGKMYWAQSTFTDALSDIAVLMGLVVILWSRRTLGQSWSSEIVIQEHHDLIEIGPYARVRHPMYSGILLMLLGVAIYFGHYMWIVIFVCSLFGLYFKSRMEEKLLSGNFPGYAEYEKRTKALIPFVW
jgi:protein-S-isoprenylcysteine O-methyltransferase Ste14